MPTTGNKMLRFLAAATLIVVRFGCSTAGVGPPDNWSIPQLAELQVIPPEDVATGPVLAFTAKAA
jgi:hypothetical protein